MQTQFQIRNVEPAVTFYNQFNFLSILLLTKKKKKKNSVQQIFIRLNYMNNLVFKTLENFLFLWFIEKKSSMLTKLEYKKMSKSTPAHTQLKEAFITVTMAICFQRGTSQTQFFNNLGYSQDLKDCHKNVIINNNNNKSVT